MNSFLIELSSSSNLRLCSNICLKRLKLIKLSSLPLKSVETDFAVDSSGFSTGQFMRWLDVKYGKEEDRRMWIKVHLMCGVKTNIVTFS
jgi:hypothetical protein